jgi:hypothetical protein
MAQRATVQLSCPSAQSADITYNFSAPASTVSQKVVKVFTFAQDVWKISMEYDVFQQLQASVHSLYEENAPLHHSTNARSLTVKPNASSLCVLDYHAYKDLTQTEIQQIFRHRHILVTGAPVEPLVDTDKAILPHGNQYMHRPLHGAFLELEVFKILTGYNSGRTAHPRITA